MRTNVYFYGKYGTFFLKIERVSTERERVTIETVSIERVTIERKFR